MKHILTKPKRTLLALVIVLQLSLMLVAAASAQTGSGFDLSWHVVASGGSRMIVTGYQLDGTVGQVAVGETDTTGRSMLQGFWYGLLRAVQLYLPITMKH